VAAVWTAGFVLGVLEARALAGVLLDGAAARSIGRHLQRKMKRAVVLAWQHSVFTVMIHENR